jgi:hypothetical protein
MPGQVERTLRPEDAMPSRLRRLLSSAFCALAVASPVAGQSTVDVNALGPKVGARAIDFRLVDQSGQPRTLDSVAGPKGTMLVFFRSADW